MAGFVLKAQLADLANLAADELIFGQALTGSVQGPMAFVVAATVVLVWRC